MRYIPVIGSIWWLCHYRKSNKLTIEQTAESINDGWIAAGTTIGLVLIMVFGLLFFLNITI